MNADTYCTKCTAQCDLEDMTGCSLCTRIDLCESCAAECESEHTATLTSKVNLDELEKEVKQ